MFCFTEEYMAEKQMSALSTPEASSKVRFSDKDNFRVFNANAPPRNVSRNKEITFSPESIDAALVSTGKTYRKGYASGSLNTYLEGIVSQIANPSAYLHTYPSRIYDIIFALQNPIVEKEFVFFSFEHTNIFPIVSTIIIPGVSGQEVFELEAIVLNNETYVRKGNEFEKRYPSVGGTVALKEIQGADMLVYRTGGNTVADVGDALLSDVARTLAAEEPVQVQGQEQEQAQDALLSDVARTLSGEQVQGQRQAPVQAQGEEQEQAQDTLLSDVARTLSNP
jgi:hypothetical protein